MALIPIRQYNKNQIILNSDRLVFNSKTDNIILSSKNDVAINMDGAFHINIGPSGKQSAENNYFILNAAKIQFGTGKVEPIPKGDSLNKVLMDMINALNELATNLQTATGIGVGTVSEPTINAAGIKLKGQINNIRSQIDGIKSKVSFTQ